MPAPKKLEITKQYESDRPKKCIRYTKTRYEEKHEKRKAEEQEEMIMRVQRDSLLRRLAIVFDPPDLWSDSRRARALARDDKV